MKTRTRVVLIYPHGELPPVSREHMEEFFLPALLMTLPQVESTSLDMGGSGRHDQATIELTFVRDISWLLDSLEWRAALCQFPFAEVIEPLVVLPDRQAPQAWETQFACAGS